MDGSHRAGFTLPVKVLRFLYDRWFSAVITEFKNSFEKKKEKDCGVNTDNSTDSDT